MTATELKKLSASELEKKLADLKEELFNLRFQLAINQLENPMRISAVKKDIARVSTVLRQLELENRLLLPSVSELRNLQHRKVKRLQHPYPILR